MVYIYVCKRFRVCMDMVSGRDNEWVLGLLAQYAKRRSELLKLERAELTAKKQLNSCFDASTDLFKLQLVYKDQQGREHELKWLIKVARSDESAVADLLLRHEKLIFGRLMSDLRNELRQKAANRVEDVGLKDLLVVPEFVHEESDANVQCAKTVLVLDDLEERDFYSHIIVARIEKQQDSGQSSSEPGLNLAHMRVMTQSIARFHAVGMALREAQAATTNRLRAQTESHDDFSSADDLATLSNINIGAKESQSKMVCRVKSWRRTREALVRRYPFLCPSERRRSTLNHVLEHRQRLMDMFSRLLAKCFPGEQHLGDIFDYIRSSADAILELGDEQSADGPLCSISLGVVEGRHFLFRYDSDEEQKVEQKARKKRVVKVQRSQSERLKREEKMAKKGMNNTTNSSVKKVNHFPTTCSPVIKPKMNAKSCARTPSGSSIRPTSKLVNPVLAQVRAKDDAQVQITMEKKKSSRLAQPKDPNVTPRRAALVNAKYVTYGPITRDLAVLLFSTASSTVRRFYLIKLLQLYAETLAISLGKMGIDADQLGLSFAQVHADFQTHLLYAFLLTVLLAMASTSEEDLDSFVETARDEERESKGETKGFVPMSWERAEFLADMVRDVGAFVESFDFQLNLPVTNFLRYHELWEMVGVVEASHLDEEKQVENEEENEEEEEEYSEEEE